jgi:medium-chain acyl-[acyl-carrier-protein] hydrolase
MDFSRDYFVHYYEADSSLRLTLPSLVRYFEDIAILHSSSVGYGLDFYRDNRCGWMLMKWDVRIDRLPEFGQTVRVGTRVNAIRKFLADRRFVMTDAEGNVFAEAATNWLFVDTDRRRPLRVPDAQCAAFSVSPSNEAAFVSIDDVGQADSSRSASAPLSVRAGSVDIDTNSHVNNVSYIEWALDSLPPGFASERQVARMRAQYRKELVEGAAAEVFAVVSDGTDGAATTQHGVRAGADEFCSVEIGWKPRR